ncbi:MAG: hypothetical protein OXI81_06805 [Paracoccaceae bacterium]|nr:hypothetical protein [Paracoccaceae bacterium]
MRNLLSSPERGPGYASRIAGSHRKFTEHAACQINIGINAIGHRAHGVHLEPPSGERGIRMEPDRE